MADVKKLNGYNINDAVARAAIDAINNKWVLDSSLSKIWFHWVGTDGSQRLEIFIYFTDPNTQLMIQFNYSGPLNFFVTNDNGEHWTQIWGK